MTEQEIEQAAKEYAQLNSIKRDPMMIISAELDFRSGVELGLKKRDEYAEEYAKAYLKWFLNDDTYGQKTMG